MEVDARRFSLTRKHGGKQRTRADHTGRSLLVCTVGEFLLGLATCYWLLIAGVYEAVKNSIAAYWKLRSLEILTVS